MQEAQRWRTEAEIVLLLFLISFPFLHLLIRLSLPPLFWQHFSLCSGRVCQNSSEKQGGEGEEGDKRWRKQHEQMGGEGSQNSDIRMGFYSTNGIWPQSFSQLLSLGALLSVCIFRDGLKVELTHLVPPKTHTNNITWHHKVAWSSGNSEKKIS